MNKKTIEQQVAEAILQQATTSIEIDGHTFEVAPPSPATLILVPIHSHPRLSATTSQMTAIDKKTDNILFETLRTAKDADVIGKIAATLILGAKRIREARQITVATKRTWSWRKMRFVTEDVTMPEFDFLTRAILEEISPATLSQVISQRFLDMQVADFFGLSTSLSEINITRRTREVEETASGE